MYGDGMARRRSLQQDLRLAYSGRSRGLARALHYLDGCPVGSWPETTQAESQILGELPIRQDRSYTVDDFIEAAYRIDSNDRYRTRDT